MATLATAAIVASTGASLLSAGTQISAGKSAVKEAEVSAQIQEVAATQREADRKDALARALATANAQAGASGILFEGSPLTVLQESIRSEETATERDLFNTRISALTTRARGQTARGQARLGAATSLLRGGTDVAQLIPE